jgi:hypothetical protein
MPPILLKRLFVTCISIPNNISARWLKLGDQLQVTIYG